MQISMAGGLIFLPLSLSLTLFGHLLDLINVIVISLGTNGHGELLMMMTLHANLRRE
jgi:hypothetical protein